jgi:hypothetical protein
VPVNEKGLNYNIKKDLHRMKTRLCNFYGKSVLLLSPHLIVVEIEKVGVAL